MYRIYCIEDVNDLKYIGLTNQTLQKRFTKHVYDKNKGNYYSSSKLDLEQCIVYCIDVADNQIEGLELEEFYINSIDCVNERRIGKTFKEYYHDNKDYFDNKSKTYYQLNKERIKQNRRNRYKKNK